MATDVDSLVSAFKERLTEVFGEDLESIGWTLKIADKYLDKNGQLRQTYYVFTDSGQKREIQLTYDHVLSIALARLTQKVQGGEDRIFGADTEFAIMTRDEEKMQQTNEEAFSHLSPAEKSVFKRIHRYIDLKIGEFIYQI